MAVYYNEFDPKAAQWLRNLIAAGHLPAGDVDERSITDVRADDIARYRSCHFFAGIGGWPLALRMAGWQDDRPVWTGSCPCQPFSAAGKGDGMSDERHLWPAWYNLIRERRPDVIFGEQVEAAIRHGWLDLVQDDLETIGYAFAPIGLPAAGFGAPHIRQRLWFVADSNEKQRERGGIIGPSRRAESANSVRSSELADAGKQRCDGQHALLQQGRQDKASAEIARGSATSKLADAASDRQQRQGARGAIEEGRQPRPECARQLPDGFEGHGTVGGLGNTVSAGLERHPRNGDGSGEWPHPSGSIATASSDDRAMPVNGFWRDADWIGCRDGKWRPVESGLSPLANGISARVVRLRAYGNAIVPQVAAEIIKAYMAFKD